MTSEIMANIKFDSYEFRRVKTMGNHTVIYTKTDLINKEVCIIPMDMHTTDRYIETLKNENGEYHMQIPIKEIILKTVSLSKNVGRIYVPNRFIGQDMLIIKAPTLKYFE